MEYWHDIQTEKSWRILQSMRGAFPFVLIGGWAVYLGPIYLANWNGYENRPLLDGSSSDAQRLFLQAVEWVGGD